MNVSSEQFEQALAALEDRLERKIELYRMQVETLAQSIDRVETNTSEIVEAFSAAKGAFTVLGWVAKAAKPIIWFGGLIALMSTFWTGIKTAVKGLL